MIEQYAKLTGFSAASLTGNGRQRGVTDARQALWLTMHRGGYSYPRIGKLFNRSHATILSGCRRVEGMLEVGDVKIVKLYEQTKEIKPMSETFVMHGFTCPYCNGRGQFTPYQVEYNKYKCDTCRVCSGTGRLSAQVIINWVPEENEFGFAR